MSGPRTLKDPRLQATTVETRSDRRKVIRRAGGAGAVYRMYGPDDRVWALKLFTRMLDHSAERFGAISDFLEQSGHEPYFVEFHYLVEGIYLGGSWYPTLRMQWCPGTGLDVYLDDHIAAGEAVDNAALAREWIRLRTDLRRRGVIHGDLQHGNVLVDERGAFRLVDYDGVVVPTMTVPDVLRTERGLPGYQHPLRLKAGPVPSLPLFRAFEDFSSLVILVSLATVDASLWERFRNDEGLLLRQRDLQDPEGSPAMAAIAATDPGASLIGRLREALSDVERSDELLAAAAGEVCGEELEPWREPDPSRSVRRSRNPGTRTATARPRATGQFSSADIARLIAGLDAGRRDAWIADQLEVTPARVHAEILRLQNELRVASRHDLPEAYRRRKADAPTGAETPDAARSSEHRPSTAAPRAKKDRPAAGASTAKPPTESAQPGPASPTRRASPDKPAAKKATPTKNAAKKATSRSPVKKKAAAPRPEPAAAQPSPPAPSHPPTPVAPAPVAPGRPPVTPSAIGGPRFPVERLGQRDRHEMPATASIRFGVGEIAALIGVIIVLLGLLSAIFGR